MEAGESVLEAKRLVLEAEESVVKVKRIHFQAKAKVRALPERAAASLTNTDWSSAQE